MEKQDIAKEASKLPSSELYAIFKKKQKQEEHEAELKINEDLKKLVDFLQGNEYIKENCPNTAITYYYQFVLTKPLTKDNTWAGNLEVKTYRIIKSEPDGDWNESYQYSIDFEPQKEKSNQYDGKFFHPNVFLEGKLQAITEEEFEKVGQFFLDVQQLHKSFNL